MTGRRVPTPQVLGNFRYILESIRPEIRQYFIESDSEATPFDRQHRAMAYQRSKRVTDTIPFGTRRCVYEPGYEFAAQSLWPRTATLDDSRVIFGGPDCAQPYSSSILNISAMSYGVPPLPLACPPHTLFTYPYPIHTLFIPFRPCRTTPS